MKRSYTVAVLAIASTLFLGGCATNPVTGTPQVDQAQVTAIEAQVQQTAAAVCGFVPTIGTVASIIASFVGASPAVSLATDAANAICHAVAPPKASFRKRKFGSSKPMVNGIPVEGYFIR